MKILIDADACPVVDITIKIANQFGIQVVLLCDTSHVIEKQGVETIIIAKGSDAVDFALVNRVNEGDIVVTQDYGLAAMVLSKKGCPINQNGLVYSNDNIEQLLFTRHIAKKVRNAGGRTKGPKKRQKEDDEKYQNSLQKLIKIKGY